MKAEQSLPNWLPSDVRRYMERHTDFLEPNSFDDLYMPIRHLIADDILMPTIWRNLGDKGVGLTFFLSLINDIGFWAMKDKMPPSEKKTLYESIDKNLSKLIDGLATSTDLQLDCQMFFEAAVYELSGQRIGAFIRQDAASEVRVAHFINVLGRIKSGLLREETQIHGTKTKERSVYPRKMNEKSSFRTYLARCISGAIEELMGKKNPQMVVAVLQVMLDDPNGISEDHLRKILNS
jgi:hypothetical protein